MFLVRILNIRLFSQQDLCVAVQVPHYPEYSAIIFYFKLSRVVNVVFFVLGDSPAFGFYVPTFRNILSIPSSWVVFTRPMKMEPKECCEMSAYKTQKTGYHPKERI
jgi:hypothetical protein